MQLGFPRGCRHGVEIYACDHAGRSDVMGGDILYGTEVHMKATKRN
jgi:hypothetical protein